jgi:predicted nucleotidyltransferase
MKALRQAIFKTLIYADLFDYPLKVEEVFQQLIVGDRRLSPRLVTVVEELAKMKRAKIVFGHKNYFALRSAKKLVDQRTKRSGLANSKRKKAKQVARLLGKITFVKLIGLTGSVAFNNAKVKDDIDLLIVTTPKRLWLTRLLIVVILEVWGKRRRPANLKNKNNQDKICLNLFLSQDNLALPKQRRNLFTAHELGQMEVLIQKGNTHAHFLKANLWVKKYLPNVFPPHRRMVALKKVKPIEGWAFFNWLERVVFWLQLVYMRKRRKNEAVGPNFAFFHPKDMSKKILADYGRKLEKCLCYS